MTNFWDPAQMPRETEIGTAAVQAARDAGVKHLIWSTLPDSEKLTGGRVKVAHFTGKARVDAAVKAAEFARHTFDATTLQTCTTEYRHHREEVLEVHWRHHVPDASRSGAQGRAAPARRFSLTPKPSC